MQQIKILFWRKIIDYKEEYGEYFSLQNLCKYVGVTRQTIEKGFKREETIERYKDILKNIKLEDMRERKQKLLKSKE